MEWFNLNETKPKMGQTCIVGNKERNLFAFGTFGVFSPDSFCAEPTFNDKVFYWTPFTLPEPPKESNE